MKKKIVIAFMTLMLSFGVTGCGWSFSHNVINMEETLKSPNPELIDFEILYDNYYSAILVDKTTGNLWYWNMANGAGGFTPIYDSDGTIKKYEE